MTLAHRSIGRRVQALETRHCEHGFVIMYCEKGERSDDRIARFVRENGAVDESKAICVNFVDAALEPSQGVHQ